MAIKFLEGCCLPYLTIARKDFTLGKYRVKVKVRAEIVQEMK